MDLEAEIGRLYAGPLDEFVSERDKLARSLTRSGDREAGARVKALRKPTVGAWALNQAVRRRRAETEALLATGERLREAHEELLTGGDPAVLRETMQEERSLTSALADCAEAIASETGKSGPALRDRVRSTLHAAAVDQEAREELAAGRFVREREAVGLGSFGVAAPAAVPAPAPKRRQPAAQRPRTKPKPAPPPPDPRLAEAERSLAEAREALAAAEADHAAAASATETAREALEQAEAAERETRRAARELEREVAKHERKLGRLRPKS
jgi:hypothetical protein